MPNNEEANRLLREAGVLGPDNQMSKQYQINPDLLKFLRENLNIDAVTYNKPFQPETFLKIQLKLGSEIISETYVDSPIGE